MSERPARGPVGLIVAVSPEGVIGVENRLPWHYPEDQRRFKRLTSGATVIMGRRTWESMNGRPLPNRRNLVVTSRPIEGVERFSDVAGALEASEGPVWFIGGAGIYEAGMPLCDFLDVTYVPDHVPVEGAARFPPIDPALFEAGPLLVHEGDPRLHRRVYERRR